MELSTIQILSQGSWPISIEQAVKVTYPTQMRMLYEKFLEYYKSKYQNRTVHMLNQYGNVELKALFNSKLIITTNVIQACILNQYNHQDTWTYKELLNKLDVPEDVL